MIHRLTALFVLFTLPLHAASDVEQRVLINPAFGKAAFLCPKSWRAKTEGGFIFGTSTVYQLSPAGAAFPLELFMNRRSDLTFAAVTDKELETFVGKEIKEMDPRRIMVGDAKAIRFGPLKDGVYLRAKIKPDKKDQYVYFAYGVRFVGKNVVTFTVYLKEEDSEILVQTLSAISSFEFKND
jgi:hypothetical protein